MKNKHSWTRQHYEHCYRTMRREDVANANPLLIGIHADIIKAADYSYQAKDHWVTAWTNIKRFDKFYEGVQSCKYSTWSLPF